MDFLTIGNNDKREKFRADRPGIAVPPGLVHSPRGDFLTIGNNDKREKFVKFMDFLTIGNKVPYFYGKNFTIYTII